MSMTSYFQSSGSYENEWHEDIDTTECDWCGDIAPADEWFEEISNDKHICPSCKDNQES
jgi:NAD-dependent SIR2 family protein deacetylase